MIKKHFAKLSLFITCFIIANAVLANDSLTISGKLTGLNSGKVYITVEVPDGKPISFSGVGNGDLFSIKIPVMQQVCPARLGTNAAAPLMRKGPNGENFSMPLPPLDLFIHQKPLKVTGEVNYIQFAQVTGDKENDAYNKFKLQSVANEKKSYKMQADHFASADANDTAKSRKIMKESYAITSGQHAKNKEFIANNPDAFASLFMLNRMRNIYTQHDFEQAFNNLDDTHKSTKIGTTLSKYIDGLSTTAVGKQGILFEKTDKDGKTVKLADFKGKVVLLDFWGSWCGPCRASHPHLKELYKQYHQQGFEIIAIASEVNKDLDKARNLWLKAIEADGIPWIHILNNETAELQNLVKEYKVSAFPTKILLDQEGKIAMRITASATDDLDNMLKKMLTK